MKYTNAVRLWNNWLLRKLPNTKFWVVMEEFYWFVDYQNKTNKITVPKWFTTDLASIPRILWLFFDKSKFIAPIFHDYLYNSRVVSRKDADLIMLEALNVEWAWFIERNCYYIWVRLWWALAYYIR